MEVSSLLCFPQLDGGIYASAGKQPPIGTPDDTQNEVAVGFNDTQAGAVAHIPDADHSIRSTTGKGLPIRVEADGGQQALLACCPETLAAGDIPQGEVTVQACTGEHATVRTEGYSKHTGLVRLQHQVWHSPLVTPEMHLAAVAARGPIASICAERHRVHEIEGIREDGLMEFGLSEIGILHLDLLQVRPTNGEARKVQAPQVAPQRF